eukprot:7560381-Pyramimonas_sp.AAC.1
MTPHGASTDSGKKRGEPGSKKVEAAKRIQQWQLDAHLRSVMSAARQGGVGADKVDRPFGGVNVLFC